MVTVNHNYTLSRLTDRISLLISISHEKKSVGLCRITKVEIVWFKIPPCAGSYIVTAIIITYFLMYGFHRSLQRSAVKYISTFNYIHSHL